MMDVTRLVRAGKAAEATVLLQRRLSGKATAPTAMAITAHGDRPQSPTSESLCPAYGRVDKAGSEQHADDWAKVSAGQAQSASQGAGFNTRWYYGETGSMEYKLYVPSGYRERPLPLLVMLHGCTQSPDDFAAGTRMNALAEECPFLVVYPAQAASANAARCWNWFDPKHQRRDRGEPAVIAGITRQISNDYAVNRERVYVAGLSAGGAAAALLGATYPDLYAAVGVHSGLPAGVARNVASAFTAMRDGGDIRERANDDRGVPTIVFHGDRDTTVHPVNGDNVIAQAAAPGLTASVRKGEIVGGHRYECTRYSDVAGRSILERWVIHGAGHAWSGGSPSGSYTDPRGPDASREMVRFFLAHTNDWSADTIGIRGA